MSTGSPKFATKPSKYLIAWNQLNFPSINLGNSALNFNAPSLVHPGIGTIVQGLYQCEGELGSLSFFEISCLPLEFGKSARHCAPPCESIIGTYGSA